MSLRFIRNNSDHVSDTSASLVAAAPWAVLARIQPIEGVLGPQNLTVFDCGTSSGAANEIRCLILAGTAGFHTGHFRVIQASPSEDTSLTTANEVADDAWHTYIAEQTTTDMTVWLDADEANKATAATTQDVPTGLDQTSWGRRIIAGSFNNFFDGDMAEVCVINRATTAAERKAFTAGASPLLLFNPREFLDYRNFIAEGNSPYLGPTMTVTGATKSEHAPTAYPFSRMAAWAPVTVTTPITAVSFNTRGISDGSTTINTTIGTEFGEVTIA